MKKVLIIAAVAATLMSGVTLFGAESAQMMYQKECGSCHMAYQPQLLPQRSWSKMMKKLDNHFDVDASLDANYNKTILVYLTSNAGDVKASTKYFSKMSNSITSNETPLRISQTPYFLREHRKIPKRFIEQKEVKSLANCTACHTTANQGSYSERAIKIPNYGRWDD
jgi:nitrate/TMAO reductase-like tetraheme cytochrome c subunit